MHHNMQTQIAKYQEISHQIASNFQQIYPSRIKSWQHLKFFFYIFLLGFHTISRKHKMQSGASEIFTSDLLSTSKKFYQYASVIPTILHPFHEHWKIILSHFCILNLNSTQSLKFEHFDELTQFAYCLVMQIKIHIES